MADTVRVKICGITRIQDAGAAVAAGAHALGFVFYERSPRYITPESAGAIVNTLPPFVTSVGVFVNASREQVEEIASISGIQAIQLHGDEKPEDCLGYCRPVIKAFRVKAMSDLLLMSEFRTSGTLIDAAIPGQWGGTGQVLDWNSAAEFLDRDDKDLRRRLILAGGLNPENIGNAIRIVRPFAVDVSSGVEDQPGIKNDTKIKELMHAVHNTVSADGAA
ncbi:MAG: phosphoribosylanthranilate isomerase [Desulfomonile tiedjei]|uniref:N-(5'-phosphoribosyl)anthranilate isomerase n=1 Tax=Desulfomonile tiedjei TaxID=2358 RepID=A0A9D6V6M7_9BACT|nr:phosphoribosylanthranilate isomerase [Desulfomonile tiedjei]